MKKLLGKWNQHLLLQQNSLTANSIPKTLNYNQSNLFYMLDQYDYVYVKHDSSGQGRAIYKVYKRADGGFCYNGFNIFAQSLNKCVTNLEEFHQVLHPFEKFGRKSGNYIIQEGIRSLTKDGQPFCIRVHVQNLQGKWLVGGMYGKIGTDSTINNGIINAHRGAQIFSINDFLSLHLDLNDTKKEKIISQLMNISISAAEVISSTFPCREYGIDLGLDQFGAPMIFEVNTTPGISPFAKIENKAIWKRIVENRKLQNLSSEL